MISNTRKKFAHSHLRSRIELLFMARAAEHGFSVSKPWGESQAYDVTVESGGKFLRVQVKSTASTSGYKGYVCSFIQTGTPPYRREQVDFFAIYVIPEDVWYIIPSEIATRQKYNILLSPRRKKQKYHRYIEAWGLLRCRNKEASEGGASQGSQGSGIARVFSFAPLGLSAWLVPPTACAVGCILTPLCG